MTCAHCAGALLAPVVLGAEALKLLGSKSTATEAQTRKLALLLEARPHNTYELRKQGISHPAGRVQNLEEEGYVIKSDRITVVDENSFSHPGVALYSLLSKPDGQEVTCS
jgi:hypothetical protein